MRSPLVLLAASVAAACTWVLVLDRVDSGEVPRLASPPSVSAPSGRSRPAPLARLQTDDPALVSAGPVERLDAARAMLTSVDWHGRVEEARGGAPIADALVRLSLDDYAVEASSGADGHFELAAFRDPGATLLVSHPRHVDLRVAEPELREGRVFRLERSGAIRGVVEGLGADGPDIEVGLWSSTGRRLDGPPLASVAPAPDRTFRFDDLDPGSYGLGVIGGDVPLVFQDGVFVRPPEETFVRLTIPSGFALAGRAVLGDGRPVAEVEVDALPEIQGIDDGIERLSARLVETDEDGRFRFTGLAEGGLDLSLVTPWGARRGARVNVSTYTAHEELEFTFAAPARISGVVRDADGGPASARVGVFGEEGRGRRGGFGFDEEDAVARLLESAAAVVRTAGDGRFVLEQVPAEEKLWIFALPGDEDPEGRGATAVLLEPLAAGSFRDDVELTLSAAVPRAGRVVDGEGNPLAGARIQLWRDMFGRRMPLGDVESDSAGEFVIFGASGADEFLFASLEGYGRAWKQLDDVPAGELVEIVLSPGLGVSGRVVDGSGYAVAGVSVQLRRDRRNSRSGRTDEYGRFEIGRLSEGAYEVRVDGDGWRLAAAERPSVVVPTDQELLLEVRRGPLEAPVRIVGEAIAGETRGPIPNLRLDGMRGGTVRIEGTRFELEGMRPGHARLELEASGYETWRLPPRVFAPGEQVDLGTFELWRAGEVRLRVLDGRGRAVRKATVRLKPLSHLDGGVGLERGPITVPFNRRERDWPYRRSVPRRKFELEVRERGFATYREVVTLDNRRSYLTVRLERGLRPPTGDK